MDVNRLRTLDVQSKQATLKDISHTLKNEISSPVLTGQPLSSGQSALSGQSSVSSNASELTGNRSASIQEYEDKIAASDSKLTPDFLQKTIDKANKHLFGSNHELSYSVHEKTGQYMIKIVDTDTKEIIREIPPEKTLDAVAKMWELAGILIDEKK